MFSAVMSRLRLVHGLLRYSRFIAVPVADYGASSVANRRMASCRTTTSCTAFVTHRRIGVLLANFCRFLVPAVPTIVVAVAIVIVAVTASIIAAGIVITSVV